MIKVICKQCGKEKEVYPSDIKVGKGKFCSNKCSYEFKKTITGKNHFSWVGDKVGYGGIHQWLKKEFGKANKCENPDCPYKDPKGYEWAKLKDKEYERNRKNFRMLCRGCHHKYDLTKESREKMSIASTGIKNGIKTRFKKGSIPWNKGLKLSNINLLKNKPIIKSNLI